MSQTITASQAMDFEQRLIALERKVGTERLEKDGVISVSSLDDRLAKLKSELQSKLSQSNKASNQESHKMIQKLLKELDPGIALTHQQQPLLYKRQMVLASAEELKQNFEQLDSISKLLTSGTKADNNKVGDSSSTNDSKTATTKSKSSSSNNKNDKKENKKKDETTAQQQQQQTQQQESSSRSSGDTLRLDQVTQAPILTQHYDGMKTEQKRLEDLTLKFKDLHARQQVLQQQLRHYLECYHTTAMAVSEKIVLADETISAKDKDRWTKM